MKSSLCIIIGEGGRKGRVPRVCDERHKHAAGLVLDVLDFWRKTLFDGFESGEGGREGGNE